MTTSEAIARARSVVRGIFTRVNRHEIYLGDCRVDDEKWIKAEIKSMRIDAEAIKLLIGELNARL